jgi:class 3 adenylate cyclase/streptogramin lyase
MTGGGGVRGFFFADLRGYTRFVESHGDAAAAELLAGYRDLVRGVIGRHEGAEIRTEGDGVYVVFASVTDAVDAALELIEAGALATSDDPAHPIRVAVGIHAGESTTTDEGPVGSAVNIAARVCAKAESGEVLVTETVRSIVRTARPYTATALGRQRLKGVSEAISIFRLERTPSGRMTRFRRQVDARRGRFAVLAALALVVVGAAGAAWAASRPPDCQTLPNTVKDVLVRIDPTRGCVITSFETGFDPGPIVATGNVIWVANVGDQTLTRYDPGTGATHTTSARGRITSIAASPDAVWVLDGDAGRIARIDATIGTEVDHLTLPSTPPRIEGQLTGGDHGNDQNPYLAGYRDMVAGGGRLWLTSSMEGDLLRIDPHRDDVTNPEHFPIERLSVIPPPSPPADLLARGVISRDPTGIGRLTFADGNVWIADEVAAGLWRAEPGSSRVATIGVAAVSTPTNAVVVAGSRVWLTHSDGTVTMTDPRSGVSEVFPVGDELAGAAADGDTIWIADSGGAEIKRLGPDGSVVTTIRLAGRPTGVTVLDGQVWVTIRGR